MPTRFRISAKTPIKGWNPDLEKQGKSIEGDVQRVIGRLRHGHIDPNGRERSEIGRSTTVRLDREANVTGGGACFQVQLNRPRSREKGTTVAQVIVRKAVFDRAQQEGDESVRAALEKTTRDALLESFRSRGRAYEVELA